MKRMRSKVMIEVYLIGQIAKKPVAVIERQQAKQREKTEIDNYDD